MKSRQIAALLLFFLLAVVPGSRAADTDLIIRGGVLYDGLGGAPRRADIAVSGDRIQAIGQLDHLSARHEIDACGLAVAPGFINKLSWAVESLLVDGRALSDIHQGITLEVFGEGFSWGPLSPEMKTELKARQADLKYDITWDTFGEHLEQLAVRGVSVNVASYLGAENPRIMVLGRGDVDPTPAQLADMQTIVHAAMRDGALGIGSSLIYAPGVYAETDELIALVRAAADYGGGYISHLRSEGNAFEEAVDELMAIARTTGADAEIYHLKAAGEANWPKLQRVFAKIEAARAEGLKVRANMYTYTAGATGLDAAMPPWVQAGGYEAWATRLQDPDMRARVLKEMRTPSKDWENLLLAAGDASRVILNAFKNPELKPLTGQTLAAVAATRGLSPEETAIDLVIEDGSQVGAVYFLMDEANVRAKIAQPWMTFGSDAGAPAPEGVFLGSNPHPRTYGNVARLLGRYVRDQQVIPLSEAIKRLTSQSAQDLKIRDRGQLTPGYKADIVIFDPTKIADKATFDSPHQLAVGMRDVFVNGVQVLKQGPHTGALPGQVVRGPGYRPQQN